MSVYAGAPDLTLPVEGSQAARQAFSGALRERTRALTQTSFAGVPGCEGANAVIARALKEAPAAVFAAMRRTSVHVHFEAARYVEGALRNERLARGYTSLLVELASVGALGEPVRTSLEGRVVVRSARATVTLAPGSVLSSAGIVPAPTREATHVVLEDDVCLALFDDNPLAMNEAHPDKEGNALDLGGHAPSEWIASLKDALDRIERHLPLLRQEMTLGLQQFVPVGYHAERHLSASYREALGTVYLTLHPDPMTMTEAVIHEFQHNKLNAALDLDPFIRNAFDTLVTSPVRPDPRPLHGVLLAVHAFMPVAELYLRMKAADDPRARSPRFTERLAKIVAGNHEGLQTVLAHAKPTPAGDALLAEMRAIDDRHRAAIA